MSLKIKVCGMRDPKNIRAIEALRPDFMGFIFSPGSPRYVGADFDPALLKALPHSTKAVGVFVNQSAQEVGAIIEKYHLSCVQLHGDESPEYCQKIRSDHPQVEIIKALTVGSGFDIHGIAPYFEVAAHLLFDSGGAQRGGNGVTFDWNLLSQYRGHRPFFLAGGISAEHAAALKRVRATMPMLFAVDLNSRFETAPAMKSTALLSNFIRELRA